MLEVNSELYEDLYAKFFTELSDYANIKILQKL